MIYEISFMTSTFQVKKSVSVNDQDLNISQTYYNDLVRKDLIINGRKQQILKIKSTVNLMQLKKILKKHDSYLHVFILD